MAQKTVNGWKTCSRGHKWRGAGVCPTCWPGQARRKATTRPRRRTATAADDAP